MHVGHSRRKRNESFQHFFLVSRPRRTVLRLPASCGRPRGADRNPDRFFRLLLGRIGNGGSSYSASGRCRLQSGSATPLDDALKNGSAPCGGVVTGCSSGRLSSSLRRNKDRGIPRARDVVTEALNLRPEGSGGPMLADLVVAHGGRTRCAARDHRMRFGPTSIRTPPYPHSRIRL
jgi:hypothetical protein